LLLPAAVNLKELQYSSLYLKSSFNDAPSLLKSI